MLTRLQKQRKASGFWGTARRRRWWICLSVFLCWFASFELLANRETSGFLGGEASNSPQQQFQDPHLQSKLPIKSSAPGRFMFSLGGLSLGIAIGIGLAWLIEVNDLRVRGEQDTGSFIPVGILVSVPHLSVPGEEIRLGLIRRAEQIAMGAMLALILAGNIYIFIRW